MIKQGRTIYCHFSFRRPRNTGTGLFAVAFYHDFEGTKKILSETCKRDLWQDHQFVTSVQAYNNALEVIYGYQGQMRSSGISQVMLVTDSSILAGWIENPKKNKEYVGYMEKAVHAYRVGGPKEIVIGIGLCEPRKAEKSYKYCKEEYVVQDYTRKEKACIGNKLDIGDIGYSTVSEILRNDKAVPEIEGIEEV